MNKELNKEELQDIKSLAERSVTHWVAQDANRAGLLLPDVILSRLISTIEALQKELNGVGVEQYYALQAKCREQAKELARERSMHNDLFQNREKWRMHSEDLVVENEQLRSQLAEAVERFAQIIIKSNEEPFNVQFIVKPLRDIAQKALSHIEGKENQYVATHGSEKDQ